PRVYEFIAPANSLVHEAEKALTPKGDRRRQFEVFRELWRKSPIFRLSLALATISPFLEVLGAAPIAFHLAGRTGLGKTTLLRLAISAYADPDSPLTKIDLAKDTDNYADAQLGMLHNFPILLDETTLTSADRIAEAAYNIAVGRTKGRLLGADQQ